MSCAKSTLKFTLVILNFFNWLAGALILSASIYAINKYSEIETIRNRIIFSISVDSCLLLFTMIGCAAALKESVRFLWAYIGLMVILLGLQIVYSTFYPTNYAHIAQDVIDLLWKRMITNSSQDIYEIQTNYQCCGKLGPSDYEKQGLQIPPSCYLAQNSTSIAGLYTEGCIDAYTTAISVNSYTEQISDWSLIGIEGFTVIIGVIMTLSLKHAQRRLRYN